MTSPRSNPSLTSFFAFVLIAAPISIGCRDATGATEALREALDDTDEEVRTDADNAIERIESNEVD